MPAISVIIPACNEEKYINKTLESVFASGFKDFEVVVVLDSCTDKTLDAVKSYKKINFLSIEARKPSAARNKGAQLAKGDILVFLDADTIIPQGLLQTINDEFTHEFAVATVKARPDTKRLRDWLIISGKEFLIRSGLRKTSNGIIICRKETFQKIRGFREDLPFHEDGDFIRKAGKFLFIDSAAVIECMRRYRVLGYARPLWFWVKEFFKRTAGKGAEMYPVVR